MATNFSMYLPDASPDALKLHIDIMKHYEKLLDDVLCKIIQKYKEDGSRAFKVPRPMPNPMGWNKDVAEPERVYYVDTMDHLRAAIADGLTSMEYSAAVVLTTNFCKCLEL